ncbi:hypothetical protein [Microcoleus sp. B5-D4]|uniref:hypothetical protein n=1 Tax=Microcoleus sp. B5-D4 TaxID=2818681 RepID=UPI002FD347FE
MAIEVLSFAWKLRSSSQLVSSNLKTAQNIPNVEVPSWFDSPILGAIAKATFWLILALLPVWASWQMWQLLRFYQQQIKD